MRDIAQAAGMPLATVYYHIGSKQELLRVVCLEALSHIRHGGQSAVEGAGPLALDQLRSLIESHVRLMLGEQDDHATMLLEIRSLDESVAREVLAARDAYEELVRSVIARGQEEGVLRRDIPLHTITLLLLNLLNWTIFWYRADGGLSAEELADSVIKLFLDGAATGEPDALPEDPTSTNSPRARSRAVDATSNGEG